MKNTSLTAALLLSFATAAVVSGQDDNPLDPPRASAFNGPAWAGVFNDETKRLTFCLVPSEGAPDRFEGILVVTEQGERLISRREYKSAGSVREGALEGTIELGGKHHAFKARPDGDVLVVTSGATTGRWRRMPGQPSDLEGLRALFVQARRQLDDARANGNESAVISALKGLHGAQDRFRQGDRERDGKQDYGTVAELTEARMIDAGVATGERYGYRFDIRPSQSAPERMWFATAEPIEPGVTGRRYFAMNQEGVLYYSTTTPFTWNDACTMPEDATPEGQPERRPAPARPAPAPR